MPKMIRMRMKKILLVGVACLCFVAVFRTNWRLPDAFIHSVDTKDAAFRDLEGSLKILEPLVIHKKPEDLPKPPPLVQPKKKPKSGPDDILAMPGPKFLPNFKNPCWYEHRDSGDRLRCLPYFNLIGVDKSGTTDLWFRIIKHPDVLEMGGVMGKETHWWSWRRFGFDIWTRNGKMQPFSQYLDAFDKPAMGIARVNETYQDMPNYHRLITGEGSPTVFWDFTGWDMVPQNAHKKAEDALLTPHCMHHVTPDVKLIVLFRNPTERLYSDYLFLQLFRGSKEPLTASTFHRDVITSISMLKQCQQIHTLKHCLFNKTLHINIPVRIPVSFYAVYLKEWFKLFPRKNMLILRNEDYSRDISGHMSKVFDFLNIRKLSDDALAEIANRTRAFTRKKEHQSAGDMLPETRTLLNDFHKELNKDLATLLGDERFLWSDTGKG